MAASACGCAGESSEETTKAEEAYIGARSFEKWSEIADNELSALGVGI